MIQLFVLMTFLFSGMSADAKRKPNRSSAKKAGSGMSCANPQGSQACMVCNCFNEAGNQGYSGQVAVGKVVMTRVGLPGYPKSLCGVIKQPSQFSWLNKGSKRQSVPRGHSCYKAAAEAMKFRGYFADHYYASYIRQPRWAKRMKGVKTIGTHKFYSAHAPTGNIQFAQAQADTGVASLLIAIPALQGLITLPGDQT